VLGTGSLGVSNEIIDEEAELLIEKGIFILIESRD
jgi:thiamine pyrophosphokinase